jgi:cyclophilin family peptidyl-prolyl cis-trans isomerase
MILSSKNNHKFKKINILIKLFNENAPNIVENFLEIIKGNLKNEFN